MLPASSSGLGSCASSVQMPFLCPLKLWSPVGVRGPYLLSPAEGSEDMDVSAEVAGYSELSWRVQRDERLKMLSAGCW